MYIHRKLVTASFVLLVVALVSSCSDVSPSRSDTVQNKVHLTVHKRLKCSCCNKWIRHMLDRGFTTTSNNLNNLSTIKDTYGIHNELRSCHTSVTDDGFVFEGHIPAKFVQQFLDEKPDGARGLAVAAMPTGTPGMEFGERFQPYKIYRLNDDGSTEIYAEVNTAEEQE
jgi:hypothetical protein